MPCCSKKKDEEDENESGVELIYSIADSPPWYMCIIFGFQVCYTYNIVYFKDYSNRNN